MTVFYINIIEYGGDYINDIVSSCIKHKSKYKDHNENASFDSYKTEDWANKENKYNSSHMFTKVINKSSKSKKRKKEALIKHRKAATIFNFKKITIHKENANLKKSAITFDSIGNLDTKIVMNINRTGKNIRKLIKLDKLLQVIQKHIPDCPKFVNDLINQ